MILNSYAVLDAFVALLRLLLGLLVIGLAGAVWRQYATTDAANRSETLENRYYLLFMLVLLLVGLNVLSWPLLYLLLQSYVPEWPWVMCIYGVTRIGTDSIGSSRYLPLLLTALQIMKPAVVFASGAWFTLYLANRRTQTAPLTQRLLALLPLLGLLAAVDAAAETAYLVIPKKEIFVSTGCCTVPFDGSEEGARFVPHALLAEHFYPALQGAYYLVNGCMVAALFMAARSRSVLGGGKRLTGLLLGTLLCWPLNTLFLIEIAAPAILHLPYHHCAYDLLPAAPESVLGIILFVVGSFAVGWACVAGWFARSSETQPFLSSQVRAILWLAWFGYLGSLIMTAVELALG